MNKTEYMLKAYVHESDTGAPKIFSQELWINHNGTCISLGKYGVVTPMTLDQYNHYREDQENHSIMSIEGAIDLLNEYQFEKALGEGGSKTIRTTLNIVPNTFKRIIQDLDAELVHEKFLEEFHTCSFNLKDIDNGRIVVSGSSNKNTLMSLGFTCEFESYLYLTKNYSARRTPEVTIVDNKFIGDQHFSTLAEVKKKLNDITFTFKQRKPVGYSEALFDGDNDLDIDLDLTFE